MRFLVKILDFLLQIYSDLCLADFGREEKPSGNLRQNFKYVFFPPYCLNSFLPRFFRRTYSSWSTVPSD